MKENHNILIIIKLFAKLQVNRMRNLKKLKLFRSNKFNNSINFQILN